MKDLPEETHQNEDADRLMNGHCTECGIELGAGYLCDECDGEISQ